MTRILVQRGSASSSSGRASQNPLNQSPANLKEEEQEREPRQESGNLDDSLPEQCMISESNAFKTDECLTVENKTDEIGMEKGKSCIEESSDSVLVLKEDKNVQDAEISGPCSGQIISIASFPPPPPVPPPRPSNFGCGSRTFPINPSFGRTGSSLRPQSWPLASSRNSPSDLRPSSPRSYSEAEGYNSADEQNPRYGPSNDDAVRLVFILKFDWLMLVKVSSMMTGERTPL